MKTTTVDVPSVYARTGKVEAAELSIKAELDSNNDLVFLFYGANNVEGKTLIQYVRNLDEAVKKFNDLMLTFLNRQSFKLKEIADARE